MQAVLLILILTAVPRPSGQQFAVDDTVRLPTFSSLGADHATLAVNASGDICVAYHSEYAGIPGGQKQVEVLVAMHEGDGIWRATTPFHLLLGDPQVALYGPGQDSCAKPDVVPLPDDSFAVTWARRDRQNRSHGILETTRVFVRDAQRAPLPAPIVDQYASGVGHIVDPAVVVGAAGVMQDNAMLSSGDCVTVYASETSIVTGPAGETFREYDLLAMRINWSLGPQSPRFLDGPWTLASRVCFDDPPNQTQNGGLILPDMVMDDLEHIVLAWEDFRLANHPGLIGSTLGTITVRRLAGLHTSTPLAILDEDIFGSYSSGHALRRPNLSTVRHDAVNDVLLTFVEDWDNSPKPHRVRFGSLSYPSSSAANLSVWSEFYWMPSASWDDRLPSVARSMTRDYCFAVRDFPGQQALIASTHQTRTMTRLPSPIRYPQRPSTTIIPWQPPGSPLREFLVLTYEGAQAHVPADYEIFLAVFAL